MTYAFHTIVAPAFVSPLLYSQPSPIFPCVKRVAVAGMKDLYEYWKGDIAQCILEDIQGEGSVKSDTDDFLVVNVASQEVREKVLGAGTLLLPTFERASCRRVFDCDAQQYHDNTATIPTIRVSSVCLAQTRLMFECWGQPTLARSVLPVPTYWLGISCAARNV